MNQPVPPELWDPIIQRWRRAALLVKVAGYVNTLAAVLALLDAAVMPIRDLTLLVRVVLPLGIIGTVLGVSGMIGGERARARARALIIEYAGIDPEDVPP